MTTGLAVADASPQERFRVFVFLRGQKPVRNGIPGLRRQCDDMAGAGLFLADREFINDIAVVIGDIDYTQGKQVRSAQHRVDRRVEQGQVPDFAFGGEQGADESTLLGAEGSHLTDSLVLVPRAFLNFCFILSTHKSKNSIY